MMNSHGVLLENLAVSYATVKWPDKIVVALSYLDLDGITNESGKIKTDSVYSKLFESHAGDSFPDLVFVVFDKTQCDEASNLCWNFPRNIGRSITIEDGLLTHEN